jgi:hypothetical protein
MNNSKEIIKNWINKYLQTGNVFFGRSVEQATGGELYPDSPFYQSINEKPEVAELELIKDRELINFPY